MRKAYHQVNSFLIFIGIDLPKLCSVIMGLPFYFRSLLLYRRQQKKRLMQFKFGKLYPCVEDRFSEGGNVRGYYFHQDLLVARRIFENNPELHVDVGSRIDGFVAHVASFRPIEIFDIRQLTSKIHNVNYNQCDMMGVLPICYYNYCDSLSCLHALEHFGLGRYGDPIRYDGYSEGFLNLHKMLKRNGKLYFSVPIGPQRVEFNAHRVFSLEYLIEWINNFYVIDAFSYVDDRGDLFENVPFSTPNIHHNYGCFFGCGIFELTKEK
jgi:hypothetical protein